MIGQPKIDVLEVHGSACARVPQDMLWSLVEFLSWQRVRVSYTYQGADFMVTFANSDAATVRRLVEDFLHGHVPASSNEAEVLDVAM